MMTGRILADLGTISVKVFATPLIVSDAEIEQV